MFETAVVRSHVADRRISWLTVSLAAHAAAISAVLAAGLATMRLPDQAPKLMIPFIPSVAPPPALGTPSAAPARPRTSVPAAPHVAVAPIPVTAPTIIPSTITPVSPELAANDGPPSNVGLPIGSEIGVGTQAPAAPIAPDSAGPLPVGNGVKSPIVLHRVDPIYPQVALRARVSGFVVVQCIIDKAGHIRDAKVVNSSFSAFEQPAVDAVQQWVFAPGTLNGQAVDTIFELTVKFQVR